MAPFQPSGDRARWQIVYDELTGQDIGAVVTYETLGTLLQLDPDADRHAIQMAVRRAAKEYLQADKRALDVTPNKGYRIVEAAEHLRLAKGHQRRAGRQLVAGYSKTVNVDLSGLEPETRHAFEIVARAFSMQMDFNRRFDVRQQRLEAAINQVTESATRSEQEIAELRARLERLESGP